MCFVFTWEQTVTCATYSINWLVFITEMKSVYSAVRTESLKPTGYVMHQQFNIQQLYALPTLYLWVLYLPEKKLTCATYSINWLVFITEMKSVYSAVRTGSLNKAYWLRDAPTSLTFDNCRLCPHYIYVFCIYLRTNSDLCYLQRKLIGFYNRDEKCLQHGTDWVFKWSSVRLVIKGLINNSFYVFENWRGGDLSLKNM